MGVFFRTFFVATLYIIYVYAELKINKLALVDPKTAYNIRHGHIRQRNVEYIDEIGSSSNSVNAAHTLIVAGSNEDQICKNKGRLSMLFNFALKWKPSANENLLVNRDEISSPRQLLKPCPPLITVRPRRVEYFGRK